MCENKAAGHHVRPWETHMLIPTSSEVARGSRNQGIIGGVEFYSKNIIRETDVNRLILYGVFGSVFTYRGKSELMTRHVGSSHNIAINANKISSQDQEY